MTKNTKHALSAVILSLALVSPAFAGGGEAAAETENVETQSNETRIEIENEEWRLVGDLTSPETEPRAFALLLHKVAGDRSAYDQTAAALAAESIASLRIDLRGHGESTNLGVFDPELSRYMDRDDPAVVRNFEISRSGDRDVVAVMQWLEAQSEWAELPLIVVGSSYTGQEMVEAAQETKFADVYVALSPGSFTKASVAAVDPSGVPWLFVRAEKDLPFFPDLFAAIRDGSKSAEFWVLPAEGHATELLENVPDLHLKLIDWIKEQL